MAITTLDGVIAGMQPPEDYVKVGSGTQVAGRYYTPFYVAGYPGAAVAPTPGMAGAALTAYAGQIPFTNGAADQYLARFSCGSATAGVMLLCDRLWHQSGISVTTTTAQTINSVAWPARDMDGSTNGRGVRVGLEISTVTGAGASVISLSQYTNSTGTTGRVGPARVAYVAASFAGLFYDFSLQAGDVGVRSIQVGYTSTVSMTSGVVHLVAYRVLARVGVNVANAEYAVDALTGGLPKLYDNTVPFLLWQPAVTTAPTLLTGQVIYSHG